MKQRRVQDYSDDIDCISSAMLRAQIKAALGNSLPNNMYSRYRAKAGILTSHAEGRKHTRQRMISPYRALLLIGASCWESTIRQELDCRVRLKDLLPKNLALYMDQWLQESNGASLDHLLQWLDLASASYSGEDVASAISVIAGKNQKKAPSLRTIQRWASQHGGVLTSKTKIDHTLFRTLLKHAISYSSKS